MQLPHEELNGQRLNLVDQPGVHVLHDLLPCHRIHDGIRVLPREKHPNACLRTVGAEPPNQPQNDGTGKENRRFINKEDGLGGFQRSPQRCRIGTQ